MSVFWKMGASRLDNDIIANILSIHCYEYRFCRIISSVPREGREDDEVEGVDEVGVVDGGVVEGHHADVADAQHRRAVANLH